MFQILLKNGLIVDPMQGISQIGSVALRDGKIAAIGKDLPEAEAEKVFDLTGKIVAPGLIDIHCHAAVGIFSIACPPDEMGLARGVTALCDAGSVGPATFEAMRRFVITPAKTDVFCFLHLAHMGLDIAVGR
jgi:dihydroorotase